eukprot:TRINITY_DN2542_c4_g1_i1.p1 TRINITY_DN2542_c4_g1~~TRINITY_DN2542_c4_g1_i1.p1  ORF type:complete len:697 (-),score=158.74 TRINITY_DN2542_c4_g1_i1:58-2148(-)
MQTKHKFIFLLFIIFAYAKESGENSWSESIRERTTSFVVVTILILISILFEYCKDKLEEKVSSELFPIVKALYGELMIGGFLSLLTFALVQTGLLTKLSEDLFKESEFIPELVEKIHILLFLVFVVYLIEILFLLYLGMRIQKRWRTFEKNCKKPHKIVDKYLDVLKLKKNGKVNFLHPRNYLNYYWHERAMKYLVLRHLFVNHKSITEQKLPSDFDFSEYLSIHMGKTIGKIVEIPFYGWLLLDVFFFVLWGITGFDAIVQIICFIVGGFFLPLVFFLLYRRLLYIREQLLIPLPTLTTSDNSLLTSNEEQDLNPNDNEDFQINVKGTTDMMKIHLNRRVSIWQTNEDHSHEHQQLLSKHNDWHFPDVDPGYYNATIKPRSSIGKFFLGFPPSKHESLFPFDKKGPKILLLIVTLVTFISSIYIAIFAIFVSEYVYGLKALLIIKMLLWFLCIFPLVFCAVYFTPSIISVHCIVSNIEQLKSNKVISKVLRVMRTKKTVRILKLLNSLRGYVKTISLDHNEHEEEEKKKKKKKKKEIELNEEEKEQHESEKKHEMREIFTLFDTSGDGNVDSEELSAFLGTLGHKISTEEAEVIIRHHGREREGCLNFEEFFSFMNKTQEDEMEEEELIEMIFGLFDKDGDGQITIEEFQETLNLFGHPLSHSEVAELVHDLDKNGDGEICKEEFEHLFKKYSQH